MKRNQSTIESAPSAIAMASIHLAIKLLEPEIQTSREIRSKFANTNIRIKDVLKCEILLLQKLDWKMLPENLFDTCQQLYFKLKLRLI